MRKLIVTVMAGLALLLGQPEAPAARSITIGEHPGGNVVQEAVKVLRAMKQGDKARIHGRCYSACTLWIPAAECIYPNTVFGFHAPYIEETGEVAPNARKYMEKVYPKWVRDWLAANGGGFGGHLPRRLVFMHYQYASHFLPTCGQERAAGLL